MAQPRASKPVSAIVPSGAYLTHTSIRSPHIGLSPLAVASKLSSRRACRGSRP